MDTYLTDGSLVPGFQTRRSATDHDRMYQHLTLVFAEISPVIKSALADNLHNNYICINDHVCKPISLGGFAANNYISNEYFKSDFYKINSTFVAIYSAGFM